MALVANRDLLKKLFRLFPISFIKSHFNETGNQEDVIEVVSAKPIAAIVNFILIFHNVTKQNIYLLKLNRVFNINDMTGFLIEIGAESHVGNKHTYVLFPVVTYSIYLTNPVERVNITFLQPVTIEIEGRSLIIKATKLEKNIKSYFPENREPKLAKEINSETESIGLILAHFTEKIGVSINDFNVGIKALWEVDALDCMKINYRDAFSSTFITMNGELTFKEQYPQKYIEMADAPIGQSIWKFLADNDAMLKTFKCDPTLGLINITRYSDSINQTSNVISRLLEQN